MIVAMKLLIDTDVVIDYLRGTSVAIKYLQAQNADNLFLSAVTVAELYAGVREGKERNLLITFCDSFNVIPMSSEVAIQGGLWRRDYGKSYGTGLVDAIIAATAQIHKLSLVTLNKKHYPMLSKVSVPYSKS